MAESSQGKKPMSNLPKEEETLKGRHGFSPSHASDFEHCRGTQHMSGKSAEEGSCRCGKEEQPTDPAY